MKYDCIAALQRAGIAYDDAKALRRISMTLSRWHELECGTDGGAVERDEATGIPYWTYDLDRSGKRGRTKIADREKGALKRLAAIMARYPGFASYVQGDPRGAALYILTPHNLAFITKAGGSLDSMYSNGVAVMR